MPENFQLTFDKIGIDLDYFMLAPATMIDGPIVLCLHGLGSDKESHLSTAVTFCRKGFRVVSIDLARHGTRPGSDTRDAMLDIDYLGTMFGMIEQSVADICAVINHFGLDSIAVHGVSLGGIVLFAAIVCEPRITVATVAMGSPDWVGLAETLGIDAHHPALDRIARFSPLAHATRMPPCALLMLHGLNDDVVPIRGAQRLTEILEPLYADAPERFEFVAYHDLGHIYLDDMLTRSAEWTEKFHLRVPLRGSSGCIRPTVHHGFLRLVEDDGVGG